MTRLLLLAILALLLAALLLPCIAIAQENGPWDSPLGNVRSIQRSCASYQGERRWGAFTSIGLKGGNPSAVTRRSSVEDAATAEPRPSIPPTLVREVLCADDDDGAVGCIDGDGWVSSVQLAGERADVSHLSDGLYVVRNGSHRVLGRFIKLQ